MNNVRVEPVPGFLPSSSSKMGFMFLFYPRVDTLKSDPLHPKSGAGEGGGVTVVLSYTWVI